MGFGWGEAKSPYGRKCWLLIHRLQLLLSSVPYAVVIDLMPDLMPDFSQSSGEV